MSRFSVAATCELCAARFETEHDAVPLPGEDPINYNFRSALIAYDKLAVKMWLHICDKHPLQLGEGMLAQQRAAKMYAMNWAKSDPALEELKRQYRAELIIALSVTTRIEPSQAAGVPAAAPGAGAFVPPGSAESSKEKKS